MQRIRKGLWKPTPGFCLCGCGEKVRTRRGRRLFRPGHNQYNGRCFRGNTKTPKVSKRSTYGSGSRRQQAQFIEYDR
jgi:hypothetical protein